ncbi:hypothetical protein A3Q56_00099 [Intoshia linei]|uniref:Uncharacterized protein n=1 Tax=Intoshia linei TaxID=1819745 RepID=A0A177BEY9_9BILA|nr:hypothetical protein A3Q56_00099 [Intoshia linei]
MNLKFSIFLAFLVYANAESIKFYNSDFGPLVKKIRIYFKYENSSYPAELKATKILGNSVIHILLVALCEFITLPLVYLKNYSLNTDIILIGLVFIGVSSLVYPAYQSKKYYNGVKNLQKHDYIFFTHSANVCLVACLFFKSLNDIYFIYSFSINSFVNYKHLSGGAESLKLIYGVQVIGTLLMLIVYDKYSAINQVLIFVTFLVYVENYIINSFLQIYVLVFIGFEFFILTKLLVYPDLITSFYNIFVVFQSRTRFENIVDYTYKPRISLESQYTPDKVLTSGFLIGLGVLFLFIILLVISIVILISKKLVISGNSAKIYKDSPADNLIHSPTFEVMNPMNPSYTS